MSAAIPELRVENVSLSFGAVQALKNVSFRVEPGSIHSIIGPNGAGKSSLLNVLSGVYRPDGGAVRLGEHSIVGRRPHAITRLGIGRAFQNLALSGHQRVSENILLGRHALMRSGFLRTGLQTPFARNEAREHLGEVQRIGEFVGLGHRMDAPVSELSYGEQKRVELARALAMEPRVLLLDEPVAGMPSGEKREVGRLIQEIRASLGVSVVLVEHDMEMVMAISDRVTVLDFGVLIADADPARIQADEKVIAAYLGAPAGGSHEA